MSVKLYEGCWGVTRKRFVLGPMLGRVGSIYPFEIPFVGSYTPSGRIWTRIKTSDDLIAVFPTEAAARAYLTRKPWWQRIPFWPSGWGWWVVAACVLALVLTACLPTKPCKEPPPVEGVGGVNTDSSHHVEGGC